MFKRIFSNVKRAIGAIGFTFLLVSSVYAVPTVRLEAPQTPIYSGTEFSIKVYADNPDVINDHLLFFGFDTNEPLSWLQSIVIDPAFDDFSGQLNPDLPEVAGMSPGTDGSNILLATLKYTPTQTGIFDYSIYADNTLNHSLSWWSDSLFDIASSPIDAKIFNIEVLPHPVPEPATIIMLGSGLIAFTCMALKGRHSKRNKV